AHHAHVRGGAAERDDRSLADRAGDADGGRARQVPRRGDDLRPHVGADGALRPHPAQHWDRRRAGGADELRGAARGRRDVPRRRNADERDDAEPAGRALAHDLRGLRALRARRRRVRVRRRPAPRHRGAPVDGLADGGLLEGRRGFAPARPRWLARRALPVSDGARGRFVEVGMSRLRLSRLGRAQALSAAGVFAAAVLAVNANWLAARTYVRWDFTSQALYTLSQPTRELLRALDEPVEIVVLLSRADPLTVSVRHLLSAYGAETSALRVTAIDPDREPARFLAIQQKYGILSGKAEDGRVVTDASIVVARGDRHWFITPDDLLKFDEAAGRVQP